MRTISFLLASVLAVSPARAAQLEGYAVKIEGASLYLDLGAQSGLKPGSHYELAAIGAELKHPITGQSLGSDMKGLGRIAILRVEEKYAVADLSAADATSLTAGDKIRLTQTAVQTPVAPPSSAESGLRASSARSPMLNIEAVDIASGDADGDGSADVVLADARVVEVFDAEWKSLCRFENDSTAARFVSLESEDLDGDGRSEIFAVVENKFFKRLETLVLDCREGKLEQRAALPFMVRSFHDGSGLAVLGMQRVDLDDGFMGGAIHRLAFADGEYGKSSAAVKHKRLDWLYGFGFAIQDDAPILLSYEKNDRIRIFFTKGSWSTTEKFGQTAERIKLRDRELRFHPRLVVDSGENGFRGVYSVTNRARFFQMAASFNQFNRSELHYMKWNGLALEPAWKAELTGYAAGLAERPDSLLVAVVGASGRSSVWTFQK